MSDLRRRTPRKRVVQGRPGAGAYIRTATRAPSPEGDDDNGGGEQDHEATRQEAGRHGVARRARAGDSHSNHLHPNWFFVPPDQLCRSCVTYCDMKFTYPESNHFGLWVMAQNTEHAIYYPSAPRALLGIIVHLLLAAREILTAGSHDKRRPPRNGQRSPPSKSPHRQWQSLT